jgi:hypothetical protein
MFGCQRRMVADPAEKLNGSPRLKPVSILEIMLTVKSAFVVAQMKSSNSQRSHIVIDNFGAAGESKQHISGSVIAECNRHLHKISQRYLDACVRVFVLEGTVWFR